MTAAKKTEGEMPEVVTHDPGPVMHLFERSPAQVGDVAACGRRKRTTRTGDQTKPFRKCAECLAAVSGRGEETR